MGAPGAAHRSPALDARRPPIGPGQVSSPSPAAARRSITDEEVTRFLERTASRVRRDAVIEA